MNLRRPALSLFLLSSSQYTAPIRSNLPSRLTYSRGSYGSSLSFLNHQTLWTQQNGTDTKVTPPKA